MDIQYTPICHNTIRMAKNYIKEIRLHRRLTQEELAEIMGISHATVQRHENGKRQLNIDWLHRYSDALNVHPIDIVEGPAGNTPLTESEQALLENYRKMSDREQEIYLSTGKAFISDKNDKPLNKELKKEGSGQ